MNPYPDENSWWNAFTTEVNARYQQAQHPSDDGKFKWFARTAYDIAAGLTAEASEHKHLLELEAELGIAPVPPVGGAMPKLRRNGLFLETETGEPFTIIESTFFRGYERFLNGDLTTLQAALDDLRACGFNCARTFLLNTSVGHILPSEHPDFFVRLPEYAALLAGYGIYPSFVLCTQTQTLMPDPAAQVAYVRQVYAALHDVPCLISKVNENDQHDNKVSDAVLNEPKPPGAVFLVSNGSNGSDGPLVTGAPADLGEYHTNDLPEWQRKSGHNAMELAEQAHLAVWASENTRSDNDPSPVHHEDAARGCSALCEGGTFHSPEGKDAVPFGASRPSALAWCHGAKDFDLPARQGAYAHRSDLETADIIRAYSRTWQGVEHVITIRK